MYSGEEKILILGSLFHDVGKFIQRCTSKYKSHQEIGKELAEDYKEYFLKIFGNSEDDFKKFQDLILRHHNRDDKNELIQILRDADHLSASQRVDMDYTEEPGEKWSHIYLSSLFSKIRLNSNEGMETLRYYKQEVLTNENYNAMIPRFDSEEEAKIHEFKYNEGVLANFRDELKSVLSFYETDDDTDSLINILLVLFEKYFWCIPDFTGNDETDISLYNHIKDTCALAHCIYLNGNSDKIMLLVGDIPGIQNYIFGVENHGAAKMLRGRSIFIQILSRNFATFFLKAFNLSEANLIMLAGGKFYILAPEVGFEAKLNDAVSKIQKYLAENFVYELNLAAGFAPFSCADMKKPGFQFGRIIESATGKLNEMKQRMHFRTFSDSSTNYSQLILKDYLHSGDAITDNTKCYLTSKPILDEMGIKAHFRDGEKNVYEQAYMEYLIGEKVVRDNVVVEIDNDFLKINADKIKNLKEIKDITENNKLIINPDINSILQSITKKQNTKNLLRNSRFFTVANFVSFRDNQILDFEKLSESSEGAEYLTLIKGDIDELGLIMSYGLERDVDVGSQNIKDLNSISRITTLSHHLKYYFSFFINGFLDTLEKEKGIRSYTVYAGGDDLMLICQQSETLNVLKLFNDSFSEFACGNPEIHISYSVTHFKHSTPIRLVADFAEDNQKKAKEANNRKMYENIDEMLENKNCFKSTERKNSTYIFETLVENENLDDLINNQEKLIKWTKEGIITAGILRNLLSLSKMIREYYQSNKTNTKKLIWHPYLTYMLKRNLKDNKRKFKQNIISVGADVFFNRILSIVNDEETEKLKTLLYPAIRGAIYSLRNS